ncbi:ComF family protein [Paenimyroides aestuarii]|uniref:ComF family protein n=1 Tax=Paenimyroides aestuarii TaxID=2968490 RepID=A0ABY5NVZ3_9FLAO|nr:ComF family protein [Paenimyroides aestuarii]UUV22633.1 ComF family protein [Paenimyroides aestuarii]
MWAIIDVFGLFYPQLCYGCDAVLQKQTDILCPSCLLHLSLVPASVSSSNEMKRRFYGKLLVEHCAAVLYFSQESITQKLLHELKYRNKQSIGFFMAQLALKQLKNQSIFNEVQAIVCIPLHKTKERKRGYNQLTVFGTALSKQLNIPFYKDFLIKTTKSKTQTKKNIFQRAKKKAEFKVNPKYHRLEQLHLLLVDDVMTTGATLQNAGKTILQNSNHKISILTMAYTR